MSQTKKALALATLGLAAVLTLAPSDAHAQRYRQSDNQGWYRIPNSTMRVWGAPRQIIRSGGTTIYIMPNSGRCWPYGYSSGYSWPYGRSDNYSWPYENYRSGRYGRSSDWRR
jgi:hypothetical protein